MARLAIADPPYLGRAGRWYGTGRTGKRKAKGHSSDRRGRDGADFHPDADKWDDPETHRALIKQLEAEFDGFALACAADNLVDLLPMLTQPHRVMVWHKLTSVPSGSRLANRWEPVIVGLPAGRLGHRYGLPTSDVLTAATPSHAGFAGAKPREWTRWVLDAMGYDPDEDEVTDLFGGSGAVGWEIAQGTLL